MTKLHAIPAFGWETRSCNANEAYANLMAGRKAATIYAKPNSDLPWNYGWAVLARERARAANNARYSHWGRNANKVMGYVPILGTIVGIYNYNVVRDMPLPNKNLHLLRSVVEMTSCGCVLAVPDLLVTMYRKAPCEAQA